MVRIALFSFLRNSLSIRLLSSYLKNNGFEVFCFFYSHALSPVDINNIVSKLKIMSISLVGISFVTDDYQKAVTLTSEIKRNLNLSVIWGGAHPSIMPEECLRHADMVCVGEGEEALLEIARGLSYSSKPSLSTKNIYFKTGSEIIRNELANLQEDLDKYPFPDFDFTTQFIMTENGFEVMSEKHLGGVYSIMTSRGCPYSCCYCYNSYRRSQYKGKGKYLRMRSMGNVIDELKQAKIKFKNLEFINFWDDTFIARSISDLVKFKGLYQEFINLPFFVLAEPMAFETQKINLLADSGLSSIQIGIQSGSESFNRDFYNRFVLNKNIIEMSNTIRNLGVVPIYDFIFNNPYETKEDLVKTIDLLLQLSKPFQLQGYNLIFYPGSEITRKALADGFISPKAEGDDFSNIQGEENSPLALKGKAVGSCRFYELRYDFTGKSYYHSLIMLASFNRVPKVAVEFFKKKETVFKHALLTIFINLYLMLANLRKRRIFSKDE